MGDLPLRDGDFFARDGDFARLDGDREGDLDLPRGFLTGLSLELPMSSSRGVPLDMCLPD